jgi:hypothetical protein
MPGRPPLLSRNLLDRWLAVVTEEEGQAGERESGGLPVTVLGRPVRIRRGYGSCSPPRTGRANSAPLSGFPRSLYTSYSHTRSVSLRSLSAAPAAAPSPLRSLSSCRRSSCSPGGVSSGRYGLLVKNTRGLRSTRVGWTHELQVKCAGPEGKPSTTMLSMKNSRWCRLSTVTAPGSPKDASTVKSAVYTTRSALTSFFSNHPTSADRLLFLGPPFPATTNSARFSQLNSSLRKIPFTSIDALVRCGRTRR